MLVQWSKLLEALGCTVDPAADALPCPLHPTDPPSLHVIINSDVCTFTCTRCRFNGDAFELVARTRGIPLSTALQLFLSGNELSHTLQTGLSGAHIEAYLNARRCQADIRDYLAQRHKDLLTPSGQTLLSGLQHAGRIHMTVPPTFGFFSATKLPPALRRLDRGAFKQDLFSVCAYEYDNDITALRLRGGTHPEQSELVRTSDTCQGVYQSCLLPDNLDKLVIAQDEWAASLVYSRMLMYSATPYPVVAVLDFPLPFKYNGVRHLYLLDIDSAPLTLRTAIQILTAPRILVASDYRPKITVIEMGKRLVEQHLLTLDSRTVSLATWISRELLACYNIGGIDDVYKLLQTVPSLVGYTAEIVDALARVSAPEPLLHCLNDPPKLTGQRAILSSGAELYRTATGYKLALRPNAEPTITLSNFTLETQRIIRTRRGKLLYQCLVRTADEAPVSAILDAKAFIGPQQMHGALQETFAKRGKAPYLVAQAHTRAPWREIRDVFRDTTVVAQEVEKLGITDELTLELPSLTIHDGGRQMTAQTKIINYLPEFNLYSKITNQHWSVDHLEPFVALWEDPSPEAAALAACISHTAFCIMQALAHCKVKHCNTLQHLLFADSQPDTWAPVLDQFTWTIGGIPHTPQLDKCAQTASHYTHLGCLPISLNCTATGARHLCSIVRNAKVNIIGLCSDIQTNELTALDNITYFGFTHAPTQLPEKLSVARLLDLRNAMAYLLQCLIVRGWDLAAQDFAAVDMPAFAMYQALGDLLGVHTGNTVAGLYHTRYAIQSVRLLPAFYTSLHALFTDGYGFECVRTDGIPHNATERTALAYIKDDVVLLSHGVLALVNRHRSQTGKPPFALATITKELQDADHLAQVSPERFPIDLTRMWVLRRHEWDTRVAHKLLLLQQTSERRMGAG